jgi:hypothetical protein
MRRTAALPLAFVPLLILAPAQASAPMVSQAGPGDEGTDPSKLVGHWGAVFMRKKLVRVPVLRDRPTISVAGPGMVTRRGPLFTTVLRDEEVPMEVDNAISLQIDGNGRFKLLTDERRAASPTNSCVVRSGSRREGVVSYANGRLALKSSGGLARSVDCEGKPRGPDTHEGASTEVYAVRREGATLILTAADGEVWELRPVKK